MHDCGSAKMCAVNGFIFGRPESPGVALRDGEQDDAWLKFPESRITARATLPNRCGGVFGACGYQAVRGRLPLNPSPHR